MLDIILTLQSPVVTECTTRFYIPKFYILPTECVCVIFANLRTNGVHFQYSAD